MHHFRNETLDFHTSSSGSHGGIPATPQVMEEAPKSGDVSCSSLHLISTTQFYQLGFQYRSGWMHLFLEKLLYLLFGFHFLYYNLERGIRGGGTIYGKDHFQPAPRFKR